FVRKPEIDRDRFRRVGRFWPTGDNRDSRFERDVLAAGRSSWGRGFGGIGPFWIRRRRVGIRPKGQVGNLRPFARGRQRQVAVSGLTLENETRPDDGWASCGERFYVGDVEGNVLIDRIQFANQVGRLPAGVKARHRRNAKAIDRVDVVDEGRDGHFGSGWRRGARSERREVVDTHQRARFFRGAFGYERRSSRDNFAELFFSALFSR